MPGKSFSEIKEGCACTSGASPDITEVRRWAAERDSILKAFDKRLQRSVTVSLDEGSFFHWKNAFIEICPIGADKDEMKYWIVVFTEHYGIHVFHTSDMEHWDQHETVPE